MVIDFGGTAIMRLGRWWLRRGREGLHGYLHFLYLLAALHLCLLAAPLHLSAPNPRSPLDFDSIEGRRNSAVSDDQTL